MSYKILIDKPALKFIAKQPKVQRERILGAIKHLPHAGDIKPMQGKKDIYRLRVGDYRIIYMVNNDVLTVQVIAAGNRGDIYK